MCQATVFVEEELPAGTIFFVEVVDSITRL